MNYSSLYDLIKALETGTKLHIGVIFFGLKRDALLTLPYDSTIHSSEYCWKIKENREDARKCFRCRQLAIRKAIRGKKAFGGLCLYGVWEYTHPIIIGGNTVGIIFIGNIYTAEKGRSIIMKRLEKRGLSHNAEHLISTMEPSFDISQCESCCRVIESYIRLLRFADGADSSSAKKQVIADIVGFIEENLSGSISIKTISELFHYNEKYIGRIFKKQMGCSIRAYIYDRRVKRAMILLRESDASITAIATQTGFENVSYFNRCFRQITGLSPTQYRQATDSDTPIAKISPM